MEPNSVPPEKEKSKYSGLIAGALIFVSMVLIAAASPGTPPTDQNTAAIAPSAQTAAQAQQVSAPQETAPTDVAPAAADVQNFPSAEAPASVQVQTATVQSDNTLSNDNSYVNSDGNTVHSPAYSNTVPAGATAQCADGTYSFSQHRQGTCSHHGGVAQWL